MNGEEEPVPGATKRCSGCGVVQEVAGFSRYASSSDGLQGRCRTCRRAYYEANRDRAAESKRAYREANRDKVAERQRAYHEANRDKLVEYQRAYREANRDRLAERQRAYYEANRDKVAEHIRRRRARKRSVPTEPVTYDDLRQVDGDSCQLCFKPIDFDLAHPDPMSRTIDHISPLSTGGWHTIENLQLAHLRCNIRKGNRSISLDTQDSADGTGADHDVAE